MALMPMFCGLEAMLRNWVSRWERRVQWRGVTREYGTRTGTLAEGGRSRILLWSREEGRWSNGGQNEGTCRGTLDFFSPPFFYGFGFGLVRLHVRFAGSAQAAHQKGGRASTTCTSLASVPLASGWCASAGQDRGSTKGQTRGPQKTVPLRPPLGRQWLSGSLLQHG